MDVVVVTVAMALVHSLPLSVCVSLAQALKAMHLHSLWRSLLQKQGQRQRQLLFDMFWAGF